MSVNQHKKKIGDHVWTINSYTGTKGVDLLQTLGTVLGESVGMFFGKSSKSADGEVLSDVDFSAIIAKVFKNLKEHNLKLSDIIQEIINDPLKDGKPINFDLDIAE